jgi:transposase
MPSDERLLVQLLSLCEQRLDSRHRRKLEAVSLLLQRRERREIEERAQVSLRTVQRWADSVPIRARDGQPARYTATRA